MFELAVKTKHNYEDEIIAAMVVLSADTATCLTLALEMGEMSSRETLRAWELCKLGSPV